MKLKSLITLLVTVSIAAHAYAQVDVNIRRSDFKSNRQGFKNAWNAVKEGDDFYELGAAAYPRASELYAKGYDYNPHVPELAYKYGVSLLHTVKHHKALKPLEKAYSENPKVAFDILYHIGRAYHLRYAFDTAIQKYNAFKATLGPSQLREFKGKIAYQVKACKTGKELLKDTTRAFIDNLGPNVNSKWDDYNPLVTADDKALYFTSRRKGTTGGEINPYNTQYYEDIYKTVRSQKRWSKAKNIGEPINSGNNEAAVSLSGDGQIMYIYNGRRRNGDIYYSLLQGDEWEKPDNLSRNINTRYHESSVSFSYNQKEMFFVSDMRNGVGGRDIYRSVKDEDGDWKDPVNVGTVINTPRNEEGVFLHPDNRTLYFSSQGHNTMGGYDIFRTERDKQGNWSEPENVGYPVNTTGDDVFLSVTAQGKFAYYSSARSGSIGGKDIYRITFLGPEKEHPQSQADHLLASIANPDQEEMIQPQVEVEKQLLAMVSGVIKDASTGKPLKATVKITDNETEQQLISKTSNSKTGDFLVSLPFGKNYGLSINKEGYLFHSENFNVKEYGKGDYEEIQLDVKLKKIEPGARIVLNNVFFKTGKAKPIPTSYPELDRLAEVMKRKPGIRIEISGHTDNVGSESFNKDLSQRRARGVVDYLAGKGIDKNRLEAVGKAFSEPIASNKTEEGRSKNRRVEAKIIE